jgi:hypothetical protein
MKPINQNLRSDNELINDVPVTKSIFQHAGIFLTIVVLLFLGSHLQQEIKPAEMTPAHGKALSHNGAIEHKNSSGRKRI